MPNTSHTIFAATSGGGSRGYENGNAAVGNPAYGSINVTRHGSWEIRGLTWGAGAANEPTIVYLGAYGGGSTPVPNDDDAAFSSVTLTGVFQDSSGATVTRTLTRSNNDFTNAAANGTRQWQFRDAKAAKLISGLSYVVTVNDSGGGNPNSGYVVSGRGDLDTIFMARSSAAIANTSFLTRGDDLAQRFEPRGSSTAVANTNFKQGATDLAQLFKNIATNPATNGNLTAGQSGSEFGYQSAAAGGAYGSSTVPVAGVNTLLKLNFSGSGGNNSVAFGNASTTPPNDDTTWQRIEVTGVFSGGSGTETRVLVRSNASGSGTSSGGGFQQRQWQVVPSGGPPLVFVNGNVYTVNIYRS